MILVVGLGNPGEKYKKTRHNLGRAAVSSWQQVTGFQNFRFEKKSNALISKGIFDKKKVILALPETFMNNSGKSVKSLSTSCPPAGEVGRGKKLPATSLIIVHDDIDLPLGKIRISKDRGSAGHKGIDSIIKELGVKNLMRIRMGIQPETGKPKNIERFVLEKFDEKEWHKAKEIISKSGLAIEMILKEGIDNAQQKYNQ